MSDFLHGIETINVVTLYGVTTTAKTGVIGLLGTSPTGDVGSLKLCTSESDDDQFGTTANISGTIRQALYAIRKQYKKAIVFVVNVKATDTPTDDEFAAALKLLDGAKTNYGYGPRIIIAPGLLSDAENITAVRGILEKYRAITILDTPADMTYTSALTSRASNGIWNFADYRVMLPFPKVNVSEQYAAYAAGLRARIDNELGFWYSTSNCPSDGLSGVSKLNVPVSWNLNDPSCQANMLNAQGITTLVNVYGAGWREWGNRSSAFPTNSDVRTFLSLIRLEDVLDDLIETNTLPYIDRPMTKTAIDEVTEMANALIRKYINDGALAPGSNVTFEEEKNSSDEMAKGHYVWTKTFCGNTPLERATYYNVIDTSLLLNNE